MPEIKLTQGKVAIVDEADFEYLSQWKWCFASTGYAVRTGRKHEPERDRTVYMHRVVIRAHEDEEVDHANMDRLDNRRSNLRIATCSENTHNKQKLARNKTGFKGVSKTPQGTFRACLGLNKRVLSIGIFKTAEAAHAAYSKAAAIHYGKFARN